MSYLCTPDPLSDGPLRVSSSILVVEDDTLLAESLEDLLEEEGYRVTLAVNGEEALERTYENLYDLYLVDINLPLLDGITLLKELRNADDTTPAIFLTSYAKKEKLKESFASGGDDYITKPFDNEELLLRIDALLRRTMGNVPEKIGDFVVEKTNMQISYKEKLLVLSKKEYELLLLFLQNANKTLSKEKIIDAIWSRSEGGSEGALRVYINRLKQHVPELRIENVLGVGYRFVS